MKYLILMVLLISSAYAEKERGGGSLNRLMFHAGAQPINEPETRKDFDVVSGFFNLGAKFIENLDDRRAKGLLEFKNFLGQRIVLTEKDIERVKFVFSRLARKNIRVTAKILSSRGDSIGFINRVKDMTVVVSQAEFNRVMNIGNPDLAVGLGASLVGHEILSLAEIENSDQFAVSASIAEDVIWRGKLLTCDTLPMVRPTWVILDRISRSIRQVGSDIAFPIDRINVDLRNNLKTVSYESITTGNNVRLSQFSSNRYLLEYEMGSQLPGAHETFYVMETQKLWCAPAQNPETDDRS